MNELTSLTDWTRADVQAAWERARSQLLQRRKSPTGHWEGRLSSSALAAATAVSALSLYRRSTEGQERAAVTAQQVRDMVGKALAWVMSRQNSDGGWGDTSGNHSNIATTLLVSSATHLSGTAGDWSDSLRRAAVYVDRQAGVAGVRRRYGVDKTFAVPILANCALAGLVSWREVAALPCEAALVPQRLFRWLQLPVVSYAIPALVAIGQAKAESDPSRNRVVRWLRGLARAPGLRLLDRMQPDSGGYLEAIPLTSFVLMSLCHIGQADHTVARQAVRFLTATFRDHGDEGTWPIDTNLATWNTTLAIWALQGAAEGASRPGGGEVLTRPLLQWLLGCQYRQRHPFTGAAPGGWGWSDLSGAVPDADDTPGALLALRHFLATADEAESGAIREAARLGIGWLLDLQNRNGGWPTFCRGWGKLPFDRSGSDLTAHAIRALVAWRGDEGRRARRLERAIERGFAFLDRRQEEAGCWRPLWFGNQDALGEENRVYGTCKVLLAYDAAGRGDTLPVRRGCNWLADQQNDDGGWGGGPSCGTETSPGDVVTSSVQETALAVEALSGTSFPQSAPDAWRRGVGWLLRAVSQGKTRETWPIGFYFAKLWYYEELYPLVFSTSALRAVLDLPDPKCGGTGKTSHPMATSQADLRGESIGG